MDFTRFFETKHLKKEKKSGLLSGISSYYTFKYNYDIELPNLESEEISEDMWGMVFLNTQSIQRV